MLRSLARTRRRRPVRLSEFWRPRYYYYSQVPIAVVRPRRVKLKVDGLEIRRVAQQTPYPPPCLSPSLAHANAHFPFELRLILSPCVYRSVRELSLDLGTLTPTPAHTLTQTQTRQQKVQLQQLQQQQQQQQQRQQWKQPILAHNYTCT